MHGRERHGVSYYVCETARRQTTLVASEHPRMVYLREDRAVGRVIEFLRTYLFGPGRREGLARALEETDPERDAHHDEAERLKAELTELAARIRRQVSHLEALEADTDAGAEIRSRLRELAALKARRERELQAAERAVAAKPDREQAQELVDLLPQLDVDAALLADESFREMLAALDFRATYEPDRSELKARATLALELLPVSGDGTSSPLSVPPAGIEPATRGLGIRCTPLCLRARTRQIRPVSRRFVLFRIRSLRDDSRRFAGPPRGRCGTAGPPVRDQSSGVRYHRFACQYDPSRYRAMGRSNNLYVEPS
jgi:hypothetical protein